MRSKAKTSTPDWSELLVKAASMPGTLSKAYTQFWNYSFGNQLLALFECMQRGLELGPIHTFRGWQRLGRFVKKDEKAITLCMPVMVKGKPLPRRAKQSVHRKRKGRRSDPCESEDVSKETEARTVFIYRPRWFVLSQTEGEPYVPVELPTWSESRSLDALKIERIAFTHPNGNCQGFARDREIAVSPVAALPHVTLFHELAHVVLGHTSEGPLHDFDRTPRSIREVEAECVALICCESLSLPGAAECRGYIQHWLAGDSIPEKSAQKIFKAADAVLKAGYTTSSTPDSE